MDPVVAASGAVSVAQAASDQIMTQFGFMEQLGQSAIGWILLHFPWAAPFVTVFAVMGVLRLMLKPAMLFLHDIAKLTPSQYDDNLLAQWENSKAYASLCWILDYVASIKLPPKGP